MSQGDDVTEPVLVYPDPPPPLLAQTLDLAGYRWKAVANASVATQHEPSGGWAGAVVCGDEDPEGAFGICRSLRKRDAPLEPILLLVSGAQFGDLELRDRLEKAVARLPANYRLLIAAHYLEGVQYEDLAEALQLPLGTIKTQIYRAKQQLRRLLETELK